MSAAQRPPYELRLHASRGWWACDWHGFWDYRDLLILLVRRDFVSKYKQTVLGPAWFVIQPLLTTFVFSVIFGRVAGIPTGGVPPTLFYLCGLLGWSYFSNNFNGTSATLVNNAGLFSKVYFPRLIVPLAVVISNLFAFLIQLVTFLGFWVWYRWLASFPTEFHLHWSLLAFPLLVLQIAILSLGVGLWMSVLTARYRDFTHLSAFLIQLWLYATPVIFPLSIIPSSWRWLVVLNPMTAPVELLKLMFLGQGDVRAMEWSASAIISGFVLLTGLLLFQKIERSFVDSV